jgi:hypothetical protein
MREDTGEALSERLLAQRVGWPGALVAEIGQSLIDAHWDRASVAALTADERPDGRPLAKQGFPPLPRPRVLHPGPGAGRPVTSPLAPARRARGHRSAGTGPRHEHHQTGRQQMMSLTGPPTRLDRLLHAHRTCLRATGLPRVPGGLAQAGTPGGSRSPRGIKRRFEPRQAHQALKRG